MRPEFINREFRDRVIAEHFRPDLNVDVGIEYEAGGLRIQEVVDSLRGSGLFRPVSTQINVGIDPTDVALMRNLLVNYYGNRFAAIFGHTSHATCT